MDFAVLGRRSGGFLVDFVDFVVLGGFRWNVVWWISCRFLVGFMVRWNSGWSGRFLVDLLSVSGGFLVGFWWVLWFERFSVEFWVVWLISGGFPVGFWWVLWSGRFSVEFWVVWWISGGFLVGFVFLGGFRWNSRWSGGFLVGFWWVLWF